MPKFYVAPEIAEATAKRNAAKNATLHPLYTVWTSMRERCRNPKAKSWKNYGGRGISVCKRWDEFFVFLADMGPRPEGTSIERKNNDGNYEPSNCKWATAKEQANNTRKNKKPLAR